MNYAAKLALAAACVAGLSTGNMPEARADFPDRVITLVVASAVGGPADIAARTLIDPMSEALGQRVIVENVSGGGGMIGAAKVAQAKPDGYTLLIHQTGFAIAASTHLKMGFNIEKDFTTVGLVNTSYSFLIGRKSFAPRNWAELVDYMRKQATSIAHPGVGTSGYMLSVLTGQSAAAKPDLVSYRGVGPALNDILGGHVGLLWAGAVAAVPAVKAGTVQVYAFGGEERSPLLPDVPTVKELGHPQLIVPFWHALFVPTGTPAPIVEKLNGALQKALADPQVVKAFSLGGVEVFPREMLSAAASEAFFRSEIARWAKVVKESNIKIEP